MSPKSSSEELKKENQRLRDLLGSLQQQLEDQESTLRMIQEVGKIGYWRWYVREGRVVLSKNLSSLLGISAEEYVLGLDRIREMIHPDDWTKKQPLLREVLEGKRGMYQIEQRVLSKQETWFWFFEAGHVVEADSQGNPLEVLGILVNIEALKHTERKLEVSDAQKRSTLDNLPYMAWLKDRKGRFIYVNETYARENGFPRDFIIGKTNWDIFPEEEARAYEVDDKVVIDTRTTKFVENQVGDRWFETFKSPIFDDRGKVIGTVGSAREITYRKKSEEELKEAKKRAEEADRVKTAFLANMSHEIRTPMVGILGFAGLLMDSQLTPAQREYVQSIKRSGDGLLMLINDLLDYSKIVTNDMVLEEFDFNSEQLVFDVLDLILPQLENRPIRLECELDESFPEYLNGDAHRLRQLLVNLLGNACKFTKEGVIGLKGIVEEEEAGRVKLHFMIQDTGIGIAPNNIERIFEPFHQADSSTARKFGGTGLGLTISQRIAQMMQGDVWAESELGKGSLFHFSGWFKRSGRKREVVGFENLKGKKLLLLDNDGFWSNTMRGWMEEVGTIVEVCSLENALQRGLEQTGKSFDFCLIHLHKVATFDTERLSTLLQSEAKIIVCSEWYSDVMRFESLELDGVFSLPISRNRFLGIVQRAFMSGAVVDSKSEKIEEKYMDRENKINVLLVEDNLINGKLAMKMMEMAGYQVEWVKNGRQAIDRIGKDPEFFQVVFMDVQMPEMDGFEATQWIRNQNISVPVVAMTAHAMKGDREKCLEAGMNDYITKPVEKEALFDMIEKWSQK